jgi:hypothetical protein
MSAVKSSEIQSWKLIFRTVRARRMLSIIVVTPISDERDLPVD